MTRVSSALCFILLIVTIVSVEISWQVRTTIPPTLLPSRNGNVVPTVEFCSGLHPPGYKRTHTSRPTPYEILAHWLHYNRITACVLNKMGIYYFGVILQFRSRNVPLDGKWKVLPYTRDQQLLFETIVDCPPGVQNTLYLTTQKKPMWFVCFDWAPRNESYLRKRLSLRVTVVRKGNIYWRSRQKVDAYKFTALQKMSPPPTITFMPKKFIPRSLRTTTEWCWADHTWRDARGKMRTYAVYLKKMVKEKENEIDTQEMLKKVGWKD